ncbi:MAG: HXXEE domain-containing protein [Bacteroidales bacterium]|nr:HXXEE domain-containing protein [Bacteroidales bacterium]
MNPLNLIWLIPFLLCVHEFEEWNILDWYKKHYVNLPGSTKFSIHLHIFFFCAVAILITLASYLLYGTFLFSLFLAFMSGFILYNVLQHIVWTFQLKAYSPGLISGAFLLGVTVYVNIVLLNHKMASLPYYTILVIFIMPTIKTFKYKNEMTPEIRKVHLFFINLEKKWRKNRFANN